MKDLIVEGSTASVTPDVANCEDVRECPDSTESPTASQVPKFDAIPQFTREGNYRVDVSLAFLEAQLNLLSEAMEHAGDGFLHLDPDFQRGHVWTREKQIAFVEFLLRGGQSSRVLYFNCPGWMRNFKGPLELVDGKQRLEACRAFLRSEIPAFGHVFSEYEDQRYMHRLHLTFCVNALPTRKEVLQWYLDLNSGGVVHTDDELDKVRKLLEIESSTTVNIVTPEGAALAEVIDPSPDSQAVTIKETSAVVGMNKSEN